MKSGDESRLWILNPDAEHELERPRGYQPNRATLEAMRGNFERFTLLTQGESASLLTDLRPARVTPQRALLWCPTPSAQRRARSLGYTVPAAPALQILANANSKASLLASALPAPPCREFLGDDEAQARVEFLLDGAGALRLKRIFSFAGRRQRRVRRPLREDDRRFIDDGVRAGGLIVENELDVRGEYSIHGIVSLDPARRRLGEPCQISADRFGSITTIAQLPLDHPHAAMMERLGELACEHLRSLRYFGPFGLDVLETPGGLVASDLNARLTLGFSIGMGPERQRAIEELFAAPSSQIRKEPHQ